MSQAQTQASRVMLGIKAGATFSSGIGADAQNSRLLLSGGGGALVRVRLLREFSLQAEGQYLQRGDNSKTTGTAIGYRMSYVAVPLLLHYHRPEGLFFEAGAALSRRLTATPNADYPPVVGTPVLKSSDVGFVAGLGYQDTTGVTVGWRYTGGLQNLYSPGPLSGSRQIQLRSSMLEFYLAYLFKPRQALRLATGTGKLVAVTTPTLIYRGGKYLLYTAPVQLLRKLGGKSKKAVSPDTTPAH